MRTWTFKLILIFATKLMSGAGALGQLANEKLTVHINDHSFICGEKLLYAVQCHTAEGDFSHLSATAYVQLIDNRGAAIVKQKVRLEDGIGQGDFLLGTDIPSGRYTLVMYTRWMLNFSPSDFFRDEIDVVNPFDFKSSNVDAVVDNQDKANSSVNIRIDLASKVVQQRSKIEFAIDNFGEQTSVVSISVRPSMPSRPPLNVPSFTRAETSISRLMDFRGELVSGRVTYKKTNQPYHGNLYFAIPDTSFVFKVSRTDSLGMFYFNVPEGFNAPALITPVSVALDEVDILIDDPFAIDFKKFLPSSFSLDQQALSLLQARLVPVQIENAYSALKPQPKAKAFPVGLFHGDPDKMYKLDDYIRFPTMEDVFREIIPEVVVRKREGNFSIVMMNASSGYRFQEAPLILVDGIPVFNVNEFMQLNPATVKKISLKLKTYYYSAAVFHGVLSVQTFTGHGGSLERGSFYTYVSPPVSPVTEFFFPTYDGTDLDRIPDFRIQLYWNPAIKLNPKSRHPVSFFTGDMKGSYTVELKGSSADGSIIDARATFSIE